MQTSLVLDYVYGVTVVIYFMTHACFFFVYYSFNKLFMNVLSNYFKKRESEFLSLNIVLAFKVYSGKNIIL